MQKQLPIDGKSSATLTIYCTQCGEVLVEVPPVHAPFILPKDCPNCSKSLAQVYQRLSLPNAKLRLPSREVLADTMLLGDIRHILLGNHQHEL